MPILKILPNAISNTESYVFGNVIATTVNIDGKDQTSVDATQNTRITIAEGVDVGQNTRMSIIEGVDATQNTNITIATNAATGAFAQANATAGGLTTANSRLDIVEGVDTTQNTRMSIIEGVNTTQNTNITAADNKAQAAFDKANTSITTSGGAITGSLNVSQNLSVTGNLTVLGTTTTINTSSFTVNDSLIQLGIGNYTSDLLDIGISAHYNDGTNAHTGFIRDHGTKEWYVFKGYTPELSANNNIDINHASFAKANVNADYFKGNVVFPDGTVQATAVNLRMTGGTTAPVNPTVGDLWYDTDIDVLLRYTNDGTSNNWVDITGPTIGRSSYIRPTYLISANVA
jgi:hypothetical protein